jgi:hypothetical protein
MVSVKRSLGAMFVACSVIGVFAIVRFDFRSGAADSRGAQPRPKVERVGTVAPEWLSKRGSEMYVGTISRVQVRQEKEEAFGTRVTGTIDLELEKTIVGDSRKTLTLNFDWRHLAEDKEVLFHEWQTEWGRHPRPQEKMRLVILLAPQDLATGGRDFLSRPTMIWELPEYGYLVPGFEALAGFVKATDDKARLDAFRQLYQIDSKNIRYFAYYLAMHLACDPVALPELRASIGDLSRLPCGAPDHPWSRTGPVARRSMAVEFMRLVAPLVSDGRDFGYCNPWDLSREFCALMAFDADLAKMDQARTVAVDWLWGELAATGSLKSEWDTLRRGAAVRGIAILKKKLGTPWVKALFASKDRDDFLNRVRQAVKSIGAKEVEAAEHLVKDLESH